MGNNSHKPAIRFQGFTDAWEQRKLGDLVSFSKGSGYSKGDLKDSGTPIILYGRLYTKYETVISKVDTFVDAKDGSVYSKGGEVIVPGSGETAEDISIASVVEKSGVLLGGDLNVITPSESLDSAFLAISISNGKPHSYMAKMAQGKSVVHLHNSDLAKIDLPYPSYEEQRRISDCFADLDNLITLHQRKYEKLITVKKSMLEKMFPRDDSNNPEIRFTGFTDRWEQRKLQDVTDAFKSGSFIATADIKENGEYPVYGGNGLRGYSSTYNHDGEFALIGRQGALCGNMNYSTGKAYFTEHAVAVKANSSSNTRFLYYLLDTMNLGQYSDQSAQPGLAVGKLVKMENMFPSKKEQDQIGAFFFSLDNLITLHHLKLEKLKNIKQSLLQNMFV